MNFYIADLHLGHENVLRFDNRQFDNIQDHDTTIINNWNNAVGIDDDVYILGDISWFNSTKTTEIFKSLNGIKHLIIGNHDKKLLKNQELRKEFCEITDYKELTFDSNNGVVLCHYPIPCFNRHYYGWYHFYGHVHNSFEWELMENVRDVMVDTHKKPCNMINVGCMMPYMEYTPKTFNDIIESYQSLKDTKEISKFVRTSK